ncbi:MAG: PD-(D/E)XK nuclease family protein, partial [Chloroflexota bacterium]|nr:PD-(D/E)XK nuclease family protein [Chloroflexota bacterium]
AEALGRDVDDAAGGVERPSLEAPVRPAPMAEPRRAAQGSDESLALSFTQIDDYLACPLKYQLRHQVRVPTPPHHALIFGNALHQAVAAANNRRLRGDAIDAALLEETLEAHWQSEGFLSQEHEAARLETGKVALSRFAERAASESDSIVAVEQPFSVRIGNDRVRGRYDAVRRTAEGLVITDYKSGDMRDPTRARQRARSSLQLQLYTLAWEAEHGAQPDAVELHFLEGDVIGQVTPSPRQLEGARKKVAKAAAGIRAGAFDATPGYPACDWCPYRRICPAAP